jgi:hypothetical protein
MTITRPVVEDTEADHDYGDVLNKIRSLGTKADDLARELDVIVGARLSEERDGAIAAALGGIVVNGEIVSTSGRLSGWNVTVAIPPGGSTKPRGVSCTCTFSDKSWHDPLLEMDRDAGIVGLLRSDLVEGAGRWGTDLADWEDIARFIDEHPWTNQPGMHELADLLRWIAKMDMRTRHELLEHVT